jgi:hypothetical protein
VRRVAFRLRLVLAVGILQGGAVHDHLTFLLDQAPISEIASRLDYRFTRAAEGSSWEK